MAVPSSRSRRLAPFLGILVAAGLLLQPMPLTAQRPINIKLATLVPSGTDLHHVLQDMAARWEEASGGRVKLTIYPDGRAGEEPEILRGMRTGDLQAGALSIAGLAHISTWVNVMAIPMSMESGEDMARVRAAFEPRLEEVFREKGYEVLFWAEAGWVRFFLPEDDASIEKVKTYKFPAWGASATTDLWRDAGFQVVSVNIGEILPGLLTGLVDAVGTTPLVMGPNQWFTQAPYMIEMPFAPLLGATIIDRRAWERIPDDLRPELLRIARETGEENQDKIRDLETRAISAMVDNGLTIVTPPPDIVAEWRSLVESHYPGMKGAVIPADWFEEALVIARQGRGG